MKRKLFFCLLLSFLFSSISVCFSAENDTVYIDKKTALKIQPKLKKWLDFYKLDIYKFRQIPVNGTFASNLFIENDTTSTYYRKYDTKADDIYDPVMNEYSPDKKRYVNILSSIGVYREDNGKYYYMGGDDCEEIRMIDREKKENYMIIWNGSGEFSEAVFWITNDLFVVAGGSWYDGTVSIELFDIANKKYSYYQSKSDGKPRDYLREVTFKEKNIVEE